MRRTRGERLLWRGAGALVAVAGLLAAQRIGCSADGIVILQDERAPWIMADTPVRAELEQWGRRDAPRTRFSTKFALREAARPAELRLRAFGRARVFLNGAAVRGLSDGAEVSWKRWRRAEVSALVGRGENALQVEVENPRGPALLALRLEAPEVAVATGPDWTAVTEDGAERPARLASDVRRHPEAYAGERPLQALWAVRDPLAALLVLSAVAFLGLRRRLGDEGLQPLWLAAGAGVAAAWYFLFATKFVSLGLRVGFDAPNHLDYTELLWSERRVPLATDHWAAYHPPLFYLVSGAAAELFEAVGGAAARVPGLKLVPFLSGLCNVALAAALARRLLPGQPAAWIYATLFAGFLPLNLYVAAYYSNEGLHAALAGAALLVAVGLLLDGAARRRRVALLSLLLGLACLTKFTALLVAAVLLPAVALALGAARPRAVAAGLAALALPLLAVAGWFYARNLLEFGQPLVGNWDLPGPGRTWWSAPGFHTPAYYLGFGEVLARPFFAGFVSFWDALYSTLWGDGLLAGGSGLRTRHRAWSYEFMAAGYLLALPATALLGAGFSLAVRRARRDAQPGRRAAFGLLVVLCASLGFALFLLTLRLPYHGQARASYLLALTPALALFFSLAATALDGRLAARGWTAARAVWFAWLGACLGVFYLGFAA